jgi:hypothetical protein
VDAASEPDAWACILHQDFARTLYRLSAVVIFNEVVECVEHKRCIEAFFFVIRL